MYHILTRKEEALIRRVLIAQVNKPAKGDWSNVVQEDMDSVGLDSISFEDLSKMSKDQLKILLNDKISECALKELEYWKVESKKKAETTYHKLEVQSYLTDPKISVKLNQLIFRWRTKIIKVGWNYGQNELFTLCADADDT